MTTAANNIFPQLAAELHRLERLGDIKKLNAFMASAKYNEGFACLTATQKGKIGILIGKAFSKADQKLAPIPLYSKKGWRYWTEERIAKLKAVEARTGSDEAIARAFGISLKAAMRARRRHVGPRPLQLFGASAPIFDRAA